MFKCFFCLTMIIDHKIQRKHSILLRYPSAWQWQNVLDKPFSIIQRICNWIDEKSMRIKLYFCRSASLRLNKYVRHDLEIAYHRLLRQCSCRGEIKMNCWLFRKSKIWRRKNGKSDEVKKQLEMPCGKCLKIECCQFELGACAFWQTARKSTSPRWKERERESHHHIQCSSSIRIRLVFNKNVFLFSFSFNFFLLFFVKDRESFNLPRRTHKIHIRKLQTVRCCKLKFIKSVMYI